VTGFESKIAIVLRDDLEGWQRLNATAFLVSAIAGSRPELLGEVYRDADGTEYLPMFGQPVLVFQAPADVLVAARQRAVARGLRLSVFTRELFKTNNDEDNRAAVSSVSGADLDLVGIALHGPRTAVDKVVKGARLHP
jgi:hypothetical protein